MSVVFASFAVAVYGTHQNWKKAAKDMDEKRKAAVAEVQKAEEEKANLTKQIEAEQLAKREALAKLETRARRIGQAARRNVEATRCAGGQGQRMPSPRLTWPSRIWPS